MKKKKILFLLQLPPPVHGSSTINQIIVEDEQISNKYDTLIIPLRFAADISSIGKFSLKKIFIACKISVILFWELIKFRPDMVYFSNAPLGFAFYRDAWFSFIIKIFPTKLLLHIHGKGIDKLSKKSKLYSAFARAMLKNTYMICLSDFLKSDVEKFVNFPIYIVNNGIPVFKEHEKLESSKSEKVRILFLSNFVKSKGILDLIEACKQLKVADTEYEIRLVGKPYEVSHAMILNHIDKYSSQSVIKIIGPKYGIEKYKEIANADILVLPTYNEAFPLVVLEAMQFGKAIISTYEGGIPDIIDDNVNGMLVKPRDIGELSEKLEQLIIDNSLRNKLGEKAKIKFFEKYTIDHFKKNMHTAFNHVLEE